MTLSSPPPISRTTTKTISQIPNKYKERQMNNIENLYKGQEVSQMPIMEGHCLLITKMWKKRKIIIAN